jgi:hypothetical protein
MAFNRTRTALLGLALAVIASPLFAQSIWKWRDANGRIQVSDQAPPVSVPEKNILSRPGGQPPSVVPAEGIGAAPSPVPATTTATVPPGTDPTLEARTRKLQAEKTAADAERKRADKANEAARKADSCQRARNQLAMLESGVRASRPNDKGEREFLDDKGRADEVERTRRQVNSNCD